MSRVKVTCFYNNKRWIVTVNETKTMYDILDYMVQHKYIPTGLGVRQLKDSPCKMEWKFREKLGICCIRFRAEISNYSW